MKDNEKKGLLELHIKLGSAEFSASGKEETVQKERNIFFSELEKYSIQLSHPQTISDQPEESHTNHPPLISGTTISLPAEDFSSFAELEKWANPSKDTHIVRCAAYYLRYYENKDLFTANDIKTLLQRNRINTPKNIPRAISLNIKQGFIVEPEQEKQRKKVYRCINEATEKWLEKRLSSSEESAR